jgi:hypothetical protein
LFDVLNKLYVFELSNASTLYQIILLFENCLIN